MKQIAILGSTGSIGTQTLEVIERLDGYSPFIITTNTRTDILSEQISKYSPTYAVITNLDAYNEFIDSYNSATIISYGLDSIIDLINTKKIDFLVNSLVGNIGLSPTVCAIENKIDIGLANKEVLVTCGEIIMDMAHNNNVSIYPIDSEHSAIFQCLQGNYHNKIDKILLTCSGGPFRGYSKSDLENVSLSQALKHPNWSMGKKITIDSATLMNKGLEVIEARWLFGVEPKDIEVVVHKESIIHSMVQYADGSILSQLGTPDMKLPISYALTYPNRIDLSFPKLDIFAKNLTFEKPDIDSFRCLYLAYKSLEMGGLMPCVLNSANETLVALFLDEKIKFTDIPKYIEMSLDYFSSTKLEYNLENIYKITEEVKNYILEII